ncbi:hypothetical protein ACSBR2_009199 [Camellia fascicularis]
MASLMSSSSSIPSNLALLITNFSSFVTVKLDASNFSIWKNQVQNALRAKNLLGYVDGTLPCPPSVIKDSTGIEIPNPDH